MSGPIARLIPLISNNELSGSENNSNNNNNNNSNSLQQQQQQNRPTLVLHDNQSLQLGRNTTTNITDTEISRHLATISCENGQVFLRVIKKDKPRRQPQQQPHHHHAVHVQNRLVKTYSNVPLQHNDVIALRGNDYCYTLLYCTPNQTMSSSSSSSSQEQQQQQSQSNNNNNKSLFPPVNLLDDSSCPICMDLLVQATALHPCGHLFCKQCCRHLQRRGNKKPECPSCRQPVRGQTPLKTLDELVWKLVLSGHFDTDEVQSYLQRSNRTLSDAERQQLFGGSNTMVVGSNTTVGNSSNAAPPPRKRRRHRQQQPASSFVYNGSNGGTSAADAICLD